jgi:hypothetical protein
MSILLLAAFIASACGEFDPDERPGRVLGTEPKPTPTYDPHELHVTPDPDVHQPDETEEFGPTEYVPDADVPIHIHDDVHFGPPPTVEEVFHGAPLVVSGRVVEVLPAQWTTPDGKRPENPWTTGYHIITPAVIELDRPPIVDHAKLEILDVDFDGAAGERVVVAVRGGQIGDDLTTTTDPSQQLDVGTQVILRLSIHPHLQGDIQRRYETPYGPAWNVNYKFLITDDGEAVASNPLAEPLPADEVFAEYEAAADDSDE